MLEKYAKYIDHTLLLPEASLEQITKLCEEAKKYKFKSVCVNPYYVKTCKKLLKGSDVLVCSVIGFPLGQNTTEIKVAETENAIKNGADEIDMVINISQLKANDEKYNLSEINKIKTACGKKILKVIIETCLLNEKEKENACNLILKSKADFIKTSTGFNKGGATLDDIKLFKKIIKDKKLIKAAGGIKTSDDLINMIDAGADRIGTSRGVELISNTNSSDNNKY